MFYTEITLFYVYKCCCWNSEDTIMSKRTKKEKIKREDETKLITKLPTRPYRFYDFCEFDCNDYTELTEQIIERAEMLIEDIEILYREENLQIQKFTIGKTYATISKRGYKWKVEGIKKRSYSYEKRGYDFLYAFAVLTKDNVPYDTKEPFRNQQILALALESQLIQHFCFVKKDSRLGNISLDLGRKNQGYAGPVIYIAVQCS